MNLLKNKLLWIVLGATLVITAAGVGIFFYLKSTGEVAPDKDTLAMVGNKKITKTDLNEQIYGQDFKGSVDNPPETSVDKKKELLGRLIEWTVCEIEAEKEGITVSEEELNKEIKSRILSYSDSSPIESAQTREQKEVIKKTVKKELILEKIKEKVLGSKEGKYIVIHFDQNFKSAINLSAEEKAKEDIGREEKIKEDRQYAEQLANKIYQDIKSGKITFEQGMEQVKNDPRIGIEAFKKQNLNVLQPEVFTKKEFQEDRGIFALSGLKDKISGMQIGQISELFATKVEVSGKDPEKPDLKEGLYFIVKVEKGEKGKGITYEEWLKNKKEELKVKIYDKSLALKPKEQKSFIKEAKAHEGNHYCGQTNHWGVNTGTSWSSAGLVVSTAYYEANGAGPYEFSVDVNIQSLGGNGLFWTPGGKGDSGETSSLSFYTGGGGDMIGGAYSIWGDYGDIGGLECNNPGWLVLGYGHSGSMNGHHGNGYTLGCGYIHQVTVLSNGPGNGAWDTTSQTFNVTNGATIWVTFNWRKVGYNPEGWLDGASCGLSTAGDSTATGWAADRDNVNQPIDVHIYATTATYTIQNGGWVLNPGDGWYGAAIWSWYPDKRNKDVFVWFVRADINRPDLPINTGGQIPANHGFEMQFPNELRNGRTWYVYAYGINIGPGGNVPLSGNPKSFLCPHEIVCTSLNPSPASGYVPLVVDFTANIIDTFGHPITTYEWDFDYDGINFTVDRTTNTNTTNYTYTIKGKYRLAVRGSTGEPGIDSPTCPVTTDVKSSSWSKTDWVEIAP